MDRLAGRDEQDASQCQLVGGLLGDGQVAVVDGIEYAAEYAPARLMRASATHAARFGLPFQLDGPDLHRVARLDAGLDELPLDAQAGEIALEALGRFLVVEVGLRSERSIRWPTTR